MSYFVMAIYDLGSELILETTDRDYARRFINKADDPAYGEFWNHVREDRLIDVVIHEGDLANFRMTDYV